MGGKYVKLGTGVSYRVRERALRSGKVIISPWDPVEASRVFLHVPFRGDMKPPRSLQIDCTYIPGISDDATSESNSHPAGSTVMIMPLALDSHEHPKHKIRRLMVTRESTHCS